MLKLTGHSNAVIGFRWVKAIVAFAIVALLNLSGVCAQASPNRPAFDDRAVDSQPDRSREARDSDSEKDTAKKAVPAKNDSENRDAKAGAGSHSTPTSVEDRMRALEEALRLQNEKIEQMGKTIADQQKTIQILNGKSSEQPIPAAATSTTPESETKTVATASEQGQPAKADAKPDAQADQTKKLDDLYKRFGPIRFSGDVRFRMETFDNQGFDALTEPTARRRLRMRVRLAMDGQLNKNFDWGIKLASGVFTDPITTNQTLTDFYERKPFALERAFIRYDSKTDNVGVQFVAGKFEPTFRRTQLVWDDDINVEGASEALYFKTKSPLRQVRFVAFQLPFFEVSAGKDGVLYGGQAQTDWQFSSAVSANVNVGYYDWNHADQVVLGLGAATTQVNGGITNGASVTGNQNGALGTTNRIIKNAAGTPIGFLAGFNLVDVLGNLTFQAKKYPVTFTFDFVHNATSRIRDEKNGWWVGGQIGQTKEKGDWMAGYYFTRIQQDAVLVPFNFSDILGSNSRAHMPTFAYTVANGVVVQWTGLFSQRVNKIVLNSPENRYLSRMQFDVIYKF